MITLSVPLFAYGWIRGGLRTNTDGYLVRATLFQQQRPDQRLEQMRVQRALMITANDSVELISKSTL